MEMPPFGKGGSDVVWAMLFFALLIFAVAMRGLLVSLSATRKLTRVDKFARAGVALNGVSLAIPILLLVLAVGRALVLIVALTNGWPPTEHG